MPIWLRKYTFKAIQQWFDNQNSKEEPSQTLAKPLPKGPAIDTTYSTKASKK